MGKLLDFIQDRKAAQQPSIAENSQGQQRAQEKATDKSFDQVTAGHKAQLNDIKASFDKALQDPSQNVAASRPAPTDAASSPEALRQNMSGQDKAAPNLSPTTMHAGQTAVNKNTSAPAQGVSVDAPTKPAPTPSIPSRGGISYSR